MILSHRSNSHLPVELIDMWVPAFAGMTVGMKETADPKKDNSHD